MLLIGLRSATGGLDLHKVPVHHRRGAYFPCPNVPDVGIQFTAEQFQAARRPADTDTDRITFERRIAGRDPHPLPFVDDARLCVVPEPGADLAVICDGALVALIHRFDDVFDDAGIASTVLAWTDVL